MSIQQTNVGPDAEVIVTEAVTLAGAETHSPWATLDDIAWLVDAVDDWAVSYRWDLRDRWVSPQAVAQLLWDGASLNRVLWQGSRDPGGLLQLGEVDLLNGAAELELVVDPELAGRIDGACATFIEAALHRFPLRSLYIAAAQDRLDPAAFLGPCVDEVGRYPGHHRRGPGLFVDLVFYRVDVQRLPISPGKDTDVGV